MAVIAGIRVVMKQSRDAYAAVCIAVSTFVDKNYLWVVASRILSGCVSKPFECHEVLYWVKCDFSDYSGRNWISGRGICENLRSKWKNFTFEISSALYCIVSEISPEWLSVMLIIRFTLVVSKSSVFVTDEKVTNCELHRYGLITNHVGVPHKWWVC